MRDQKIKNISDFVDTHENVTILFADIVNFTKFSSGVKPNQVVNMLRRLFTEFDKQCYHHQIFKMYTIGDCYVCIGFVNGNKRKLPLEEAKNVIRMGQDMIKIIGKVRMEPEVQFPELNMRIGIHTVLFILFVSSWLTP